MTNEVRVISPRIYLVLFSEYRWHVVVAIGELVFVSPLLVMVMMEIEIQSDCSRYRDWREPRELLRIKLNQRTLIFIERSRTSKQRQSGWFERCPKTHDLRRWKSRPHLENHKVMMYSIEINGQNIGVGFGTVSSLLTIHCVPIQLRSCTNLLALIGPVRASTQPRSWLTRTRSLKCLREKNEWIICGKPKGPKVLQVSGAPASLLWLTS